MREGIEKQGRGTGDEEKKGVRDWANYTLHPFTLHAFTAV